MARFPILHMSTLTGLRTKFIVPMAYHRPGIPISFHDPRISPSLVRPHTGLHLVATSSPQILRMRLRASPNLEGYVQTNIQKQMQHNSPSCKDYNICRDLTVIFELEPRFRERLQQTIVLQFNLAIYDHLASPDI